MSDETQPTDPENSTDPDDSSDSDESGVTTYIPGMKPGHTKRNALVAIAYLVFPFLVPLALAYAFGTNRAGIADEFDSVPGVSGGSGLMSGAIAFFAGIILYGMMTAVLPWADAPEDTDDEEIEEGEDVAEAEEEETEATDEESETETDEDRTDEAGDDPPPEEDADAATDTESEETETESETDAETEPDTEAEETEPVDTEEADESDAEEDDIDEALEEDEDEDVSEEDEQEFTEDEYLYVIENTLEAEMGIDVADVYMEDDTTHVEYHSYAQDEGELAGELGAVSGAYAAAVGEGHESEQLQITVLDAVGNEAGTTTLDADTAEAYYDGEITEEELAMEVLENIEVNE